jgi:hypothetical protein
MKVEDLRRYLGEFAAISAVLYSRNSASRPFCNSGRGDRAVASIAGMIEDMADEEE